MLLGHIGNGIVKGSRIPLLSLNELEEKLQGTIVPGKLVNKTELDTSFEFK